MPTTMQSKPKGQPVKRANRAASPPTPRPKPARKRKPAPRWLIVAPMMLILLTVSARMGALAMLHYESARREQLRRETDRVKLNIEKLKGQIAVYKNEVALNRWAEQAGMVRVELQPELTILGLDTPTPPVAPVAMQPAELE